MPELPEVETVRRGLAIALAGRTLDQVEIRDGRLTAPADPNAVAHALHGAGVTGVGRRRKYLVIGLDDGSQLVSHLRMTGWFHHVAERTERPHLRALLGSTTELAALQRSAPVRNDARFSPGRAGELLARAARPGAAGAASGRRPTWGRRCAGAAPRSRRCCSTSASSPASATSTPTRRSGRPASTRWRWPGSSARRAFVACTGRSCRCSSAVSSRRRDHRQLPRRGRRGGRDARPVQRVRPLGPALPALRRGDRQDPCRPARHPPLPKMHPTALRFQQRAAEAGSTSRSRSWPSRPEPRSRPPRRWAASWARSSNRWC